jgi:SAM-dependent methyltransferase
VILELGPGSGEQLYRYDLEKVTHIYGVEPCLALIPALKAKVKELGLQGKYTIVPHGVEDLEKLAEYGLEEGGVDTVLSIRVLCSVGNVEETVRMIYRMLKPGGKIVFFEHVRSKYWFPRLLEGNLPVYPFMSKPLTWYRSTN